MTTQEIRIEIKVPTKEVFEFTTEPENTSKWRDTVQKETINTECIGLGTVYTNEYGTLTVTDYEKDAFFELTNHETGYQCSYTYHKTDDTTTELVYFESIEDDSQLREPIERRHFEVLKTLLEK